MRIATICAVGLLSGAPAFAQSASFGGFEFQDAQRDFADRVVSFVPGTPAATDERFLDPEVVLGVPNYKSRRGAVSLGNGGTLIVAFDDNAIALSGDDAPDIVVFEVGSDEEASFVAISTDGDTFYDIGRIEQGTVGLDIDAPLQAAGVAETEFKFIRIMDEAGGNGAKGRTAGADIDAVGVLTYTPAAMQDEEVAQTESDDASSDAASDQQTASEESLEILPFGPTQVGHYATADDPALRIDVQRSAFGEELMLGFTNARATWLTDGMVIDLYFDPEQQSEGLRAAFAENGRALDRCAAVMEPTGGEDLLTMVRTDCPPVLGLSIPSVRPAGAAKVAGHPSLLVRFEFEGDTRVMGGGDIVAELELRPTHSAALHQALSRRYAATEMLPGNGFDLAGLTLDLPFEELKAKATEVIEKPRDDWQERKVFELGSRQWTLFSQRIARDSLSSSPVFNTYAEAQSDLAAMFERHLGDGRANAFSSYWIIARLELPPIKREIRLSIHPEAAPAGVLVEPEEYVEIDSVELPDTGSQAFRIKRTWTPYGDNRPLAENVTAAVIEKYGDPVETSGRTMVWRYDVNGQPVRDCKSTALAQSTGSFGQAYDLIGCPVELTATVVPGQGGILYALETTLFDIRLAGADILSEQWIELQNEAVSRAEAIMSDPALEQQKQEEEAVKARESKL